MSDQIAQLFENNRAWSDHMQAEDPAYFLRLVRQQSPEYLWIGCSDSRVPANQIIGLDPGEVFVHRNVANVVVHSDLNALSVIQFAVDVLRVKHILVVGHYGCGGVRAVIKNEKHGLVDDWLRHVRDVHDRYVGQLAQVEDFTWRHDRMCELNSIHQAVNIKTGKHPIDFSHFPRNINHSVPGNIYDIESALQGVDGSKHKSVGVTPLVVLPRD